MAVKAGQILWNANGYVIDRIQTAGVTNLNIPTERVHEVGNFQTISIIRDIPDLTFEIQSFDTSADTEAVMLGLAKGQQGPGLDSYDPGNVPGGFMTFDTSIPIDVISPFRSAQSAFNATKGVVIPYLTLETVAYKFGLKANAEQTFSFRGDSIYYCPGSPYLDKFTRGASPNPAFTLSQQAQPYVESGVTQYALGVTWKDIASQTFGRLFLNVGNNSTPSKDYYDTTVGSVTTVTLNAASAALIPSTAIITITYSSATQSNYPQTVNTPALATKPGAIRSKDIDVYAGFGGGATPTMVRVPGVQAVDIQRKVNLQPDEEFGNAHYVSQDWDTADVTGTLQIKPVDVGHFISQVQQFAGVTNTNAVSGPLTSPPLELQIRISNPDTGALLKVLTIPDATFSAPPMTGKVQTKADISFKWESNGGLLYVDQGPGIPLSDLGLYGGGTATI